MRYTSSMKDLLMIFGTIVVVIVAGVLLFFYGPASLRTAFGNKTPASISFLPLKEGTDAVGMTDRTNYVIKNGTELNELWGYINAAPGTTPNIDFSKEDVLAIFDGTHTTGGYRIEVTGITQAAGGRTVHVSRIAPGANCMTAASITGPYEIVAVPKSNLPLEHVDTTVTQDCP
ncbi:MAG: hypothetical protein JWL88_434 [Parcubacteria group bacterium]|nr:hypothetical protein [Parcubacteria group bacterium]